MQFRGAEVMWAGRTRKTERALRVSCLWISAALFVPDLKGLLDREPAWCERSQLRPSPAGHLSTAGAGFQSRLLPFQLSDWASLWRTFRGCRKGQSVLWTSESKCPELSIGWTEAVVPTTESCPTSPLAKPAVFAPYGPRTQGLSPASPCRPAEAESLSQELT